ncbi:MAG: tetratricopeptide repeat protein [Cyclobacteriaceae bacterium]|nr:tetratricopeptide repeat protein [Cyclobacteriaceae bacterium]
MLCLIVLLGYDASGQLPLFDSLKRELNRTRDVQNRVELLNQLAFQYFDYDDSLASDYAQQALELSLKHNYQKGAKYAFTMVGLGCLSRGEYQEAFRNFSLSNEIKIPDAIETEVFTIILTGNVYRDIGIYDSAEYYFNQVVQLKDQALSQNILATLYKNLGYLYVLQWRNAEALSALERAEQLVDVKDLYLQAEIYFTLGILNENILNFEKADQYFIRACGIAEKSKDTFQLIKCELRKSNLQLRIGNYKDALSSCFNAINLIDKYEYLPQVSEVYTLTGEVYAELGQYDVATRYYFQALKITERLGLKRNTARLYAELAWVHKEQSNFESALDYLLRSRTLREEMNDQHGISNCLNVQGLIYYQQKKYNEAINNFEKAITIRRQIGHFEGVASSIFNLSLVYEALEQYNKSLELLEQALAAEDKINSDISKAITYNQFASLFIKMKRYAEAER